MILAALCFLGAGQSAAQQKSASQQQKMAALSAEEQAVWQPIAQLFEGMFRSDSSLVAAAFHPQARIMTCSTDRQKQPIVQEERLGDFLKAIAQPKAAPYEERIVYREIRIDGHLATAWTHYEFYVGSNFNHCGVNAFQLCKTAKGWQILHVTDTRRRENCPTAR